MKPGIRPFQPANPKPEINPLAPEKSEINPFPPEIPMHFTAGFCHLTALFLPFTSKLPKNLAIGMRRP
jgi:hypothetical protein